MIDLALEPLIAALRESELLRITESLRSDGGVDMALGGETTRLLRDEEIRQLTSDGNTAENWSQVRVAEGFRTGCIRYADFRGHVVLGRFEESIQGPGGITFLTGVFRSTIANCVIGHHALIRNVGLLASYAVGKRAVISDCGRVVCVGPTTFGNGLAIPIGPQVGGRWLRPFSEITLDLAASLTSPGSNERLWARYNELITEYLRRAESTRGAIGDGVSITNTAVVENAHIGSSAVIDATTRIENSVLLSTQDEPICVWDGACVSNSLLQWGVAVNGPAVVERAVLMEHSAVDRFGKVIDTVLGPNSAVGSGEVTASLVGPFVGCHHQSLLIAARWPGGRGNIGYGAAVGSNHTSRAPDQEAVLGEGLFIGLGAKIQFPCDLSRSPYSVLASGLNLPAQKLAFPFSLIRTATESIVGSPPGANVLIPGWVLSENLYAIQRCTFKFRTRDRAIRHRLAHDVFRSDIMALVNDAVVRLEHPAIRCSFYTEREIPGLGRSILLESHREAAVRCYRDHLERFRLMGVLDQAPLTTSDDLENWEELPRLAALLESFGEAVERSRMRDEQRGLQIIDDYGETHLPTGSDPVVRDTWEEVRRIQSHLSRTLRSLDATPEGELLPSAGS